MDLWHPSSKLLLPSHSTLRASQTFSMAGTKRSSKGENTDSEARPSKVAKTTKERSRSTGKSKVLYVISAGKASNPSQAIPYASFQAQALPIHVSLTHTPAAVIENEEEPTTSSDPGHITAVTLLPSEFSTGSYGWKGNSRIQVELQGAEGNEKEKVTVMLKCASHNIQA